MSLVPKGLSRAVKHSERKYKRACVNLNRIGFEGWAKISKTPEFKECDKEWEYLTELRGRLNFLKSCDVSLNRKFHS